MKRIVSYFLLGIGLLLGVNGFGQSEVEWVVEPTLEFDFCWGFSEDLAMVNKDGKYGYINKLGQLIIKLEFDYSQSFSEGLARVQKNGKYGYINKLGELITKIEFDAANHFSQGLALVEKDEKYGYLNTLGQLITKMEFDYASHFSEGVAMVSKNGKYGYIDTLGQVIIELNFDNAFSFSEGLAKVQKNKKWGYVNISGELVITTEFENIGEFNEGFAIVQKNGKYGYINNLGELITKIEFDWATPFSEGFADVQKHGKYGYINTSGQLITKIEFEKSHKFLDGLTAVQKNGKWDFINTSGQQITNMKFDDVNWRYREGLRKVKKDGKCSFINTSGQLITNLEFDNVWDFLDGLAMVNKNGKWGYINSIGRLVVDIKFDNARPFSEGLTFVKLNDKWGIIRHPYHNKSPKINFPNLPKTIILTDALNLDIKICITSPNEQTTTKLYVDGKVHTTRGLGKGKDSDVCDEIYTYQLTLPRNGNYEIKVTATNKYGTTTTTRLVQVVNNFDKSVRLPKGKNHAVIIGIEDYKNWTDLSTPLNDCKALAKVLVDNYNFDADNVHPFYNQAATRSNILNFLERLSEKVAPNDNLLVYYAGHGYYDKNTDTGYWIPVNAPKGKAHWDFIKDKDIKAVLCSSKCQNTYVIADACYSGSFFDKDKTRTDPLSDDMKVFVNTLQQKTSFRGFASGQLEEVEDVSANDAKHSPFAYALLQVLKEWTYPALPATFLENAVLMKVQPNTNQTPNANYVETCDDSRGKNNGQFVFYLKN